MKLEDHLEIFHVLSDRQSVVIAITNNKLAESYQDQIKAIGGVRVTKIMIS